MAARIVRQCVVCLHLRRTELELELAGGARQTAVAKKYGISSDTVHRHWNRHVDDERKARLLIGPVQQAALAARISEENSSVIDSLRVIRAGLFESYDLALKAADRNSAAQLAGRLHENLRIVANITGELAHSPLVQVNNTSVFVHDPAFASFQADLIRVLSRFPDARAAVLTEFERLEAAPSQLPALEHHSDAE
jgi:transposase-like protein